MVVVGLLWILAKFDFIYHQHTVVLERSPHRKRVQNWGRIIDILFLPALLGYLWRIHDLGRMTKKYVFSNLSMFQQLVFLGFVFLCLFTIGFLLWPAFRHEIMCKFKLNPQKYLHRAIVCVLLAVLIENAFTLSIHSDGYSLIGFSGGLSETSTLSSPLSGAMALLFVGWGTTTSYNWRGALTRLGLNRKPAWGTFFFVCLLLVAFVAIQKFMISFVHSGEPKHTIGFIPLLYMMATVPDILNGIGDELLFRGILQPRIGIWLSSIVFTLVHMPYDWITLLWTLAASLLLGWIARRYSLWLSIWFHVIYSVVFNTVSTFQ